MAYDISDDAQCLEPAEALPSYNLTGHTMQQVMLAPTGASDARTYDNGDETDDNGIIAELVQLHEDEAYARIAQSVGNRVLPPRHSYDDADCEDTIPDTSCPAE